MNNPYQDARTLNAIHCQIDMVYQALFPAMTGEQRLKMNEALKDLRRMTDKLEASEEF